MLGQMIPMVDLEWINYSNFNSILSLKTVIHRKSVRNHFGKTFAYLSLVSESIVHRQYFTTSHVLDNTQIFLESCSDIDSEK